MDYRMIINMPEKFHYLLMNIFNEMCYHEVYPSSWKVYQVMFITWQAIQKSDRVPNILINKLQGMADQYQDMDIIIPTDSQSMVIALSTISFNVKANYYNLQAKVKIFEKM